MVRIAVPQTESALSVLSPNAKRASANAVRGHLVDIIVGKLLLDPKTGRLQDYRNAIIRRRKYHVTV